MESSHEGRVMVPIFLAKLEQFKLGQVPMLYASVFAYIYTSIVL